VVDEQGLTGLDANGDVRWRTDAPGLFPELAIDDRAVCGADREAVTCWRQTDGRPTWSQALGEPAVGGPLAVGRVLLLPTRGHAEVRSMTDGRLQGRARLPGEWSAPPRPTASGRVWVFTGSDDVHVFEPGGARLVRHFSGLPELHWPPTSVHGDLIFEAQSGRRRELWVLDPDFGPSRWLAGRSSPVLVLPDFLGVVVTRGSTLEGRGADGALLYSTRLSETPRHGQAGDDWLALAGPSEAWVVDGRSGDLAVTVALPAGRVEDLGWTPRGGAVITDDGWVLGLPRPDDPRLRRLRAVVRREHTLALLKLGQRATACRRITLDDDTLPALVVGALACRGDQADTAADLIRLKAPIGSYPRALVDAPAATSE